MPEPVAGGPEFPSGVSERLHEIARLLRAADHLGPVEKEAVAELADELGNALRTAAPSSAEAAHLAGSAAHLIEALHRKENKGVLASARDRLEQAIVRAEARTPFLAGVARRLAEALTNLGI
jgi:hypothetical protein